MLLLGSLSDQVKSWQEIFGGGPLAAFLGLMIIALVAIFGLYVRANGKLQREQTSHLETVRTVTALTGAMERTWAEQLRKDQDHLRAAEELAAQQREQFRAAAELQRDTLELLQRSVVVAEYQMQHPQTPRVPA